MALNVIKEFYSTKQFTWDDLILEGIVLCPASSCL